MPRGGRLSFETANVELDETYARAHPEVRPGPFVMLAVRDTGHGMDAETQAHIFEPFFTTKEMGQGTGLGLATVFGIVHQSGGSIRIDSGVGVGTTCTIYFPRVEDEATRPVPAAKGDPARGTETILLVEDSDPLREMVHEILEAAGYTLLTSADPEEAMGRIGTAGATVGLLLTDVVMPGMSGPALARSVRLARPEMKVLFMSGYTDEAVGLQGVLGEGTRFIQTPFPADALLHQVRAVLDEPYRR
jgi:CheY-like chemotaxis protein